MVHGRLCPSGALAVMGWALIAGGCNSRRIVGDGGESIPHDTDTAASSTTPAPETSAPAPDAGGFVDAGFVDAGFVDGGLGDAGGDAGTGPSELELDLFGTFHNTFNFVVSDQQRARMNERYGGGGDIYSPGGVDIGATYVEHLIVTNSSGDTADFGKTEVRLVGESTGRAWTKSTLPNFRVDTDEFTKGQKLGGYEHVRFNNGVVSSIFREKFTLDFFRELGYPAPLAGYAWVQSAVWGEQVKIPYGVVEVYKRSFCEDRADYFGGKCSNMWEFVGDLGAQGDLEIDFSLPEVCQFSECDATRMTEWNDVVEETMPGPGYKAAMAEYLDWDAFHEYQCLSWIFATGDDALRNRNNVVIAERADGKFQYLPYSVDISFGQDWYPYVTLPGTNSIARGCQADPGCWADTVATCDVLLDAFEAADPVERLDTLYDELGAAGMLRGGDDERYRLMRAYIQERLTDMRGELDAIRDNPYAGGCDEGQVMCGDYCAHPRDCYLCDEEGAHGEPVPLANFRAVEPGGEGDAIIVEPPPVSEPRGDAGAPPLDGGVEPNPCLPHQEVYGVR